MKRNICNDPLKLQSPEGHMVVTAAEFTSHPGLDKRYQT